MASIFSTRFLATTGGVAEAFAVPAGQLAVVRCVTAINMGSAEGNWNVQITPQGVYFAGGWEPPLPTGGSVVEPQVLDLRVVVQAGESIYGASAVGVHLTVSGYLFVS
jgi:hypothetical protein